MRECALTVLDCESHESSMESIADAYNLSTADLTTFLSSVDLDEEYQTKEILTTADKYLLELFHSRFGPPTHVWDSICWFHLTRVPTNTDFAEGILPLHSVLDKIWAGVIATTDDPVKKANLEKLRQMGVPDDLYNSRTTNQLHCGPCAMLVRESAFHSREMGNHNYLELSEIVEDICNGYERKYGENIHKEISSALRKCIVKFEVAEQDGARLAAPALFYCWCKIHHQELSLSANTCYDANGVAIPHSAIRKVEFV